MSHQPNEKLAYTIREVMQVTGLGRSKIYMLFESGDLRPKKAGRRTLVLKADLENYLTGLPDAQIGSRGA